MRDSCPADVDCAAWDRNSSSQLSGDPVSSKMAASRVGSSTRRLCQRYRIFFYVAIFLVSMQLFLAWNFYTFNLEEVRRLEEWEERLKMLESKHKVCIHTFLELGHRNKKVGFWFIRRLQCCEQKIKRDLDAGRWSCVLAKENKNVIGAVRRGTMTRPSLYEHDSKEPQVYRLPRKLQCCSMYIHFANPLLQDPPPSDDSQLPPLNGQGAAEGFKVIQADEPQPPKTIMDLPGPKANNDNPGVKPRNDTLSQQKPAKSKKWGTQSCRTWATK